MTQTAVYTQLETHLQTNLASSLQLLQQMVNINSFTANPAGVNALAELTAVAFAELGFTAEQIPAENPAYGQHLFLTRPGNSHGRVLGLVSHLDTVFPASEETRNNFHWRPDGDRIYGPGTVDIKGGTVMIYMMLAAFKAVLPELFQTITWHVMLNACEEVGEDDFGRLCAARLGPDALACLVFEAGFKQENHFLLVSKRKGMVTYTVQAEGKGAHAGSAHDQGGNAIVQLAEAVQKIHQLTNYDNHLTFNVGSIHGGTVTNRVPHLATADIEMRAFDTAVYQQGIDAMLALNEMSTVSNAKGDFRCRLQVNIKHKTPPWPTNAATDRLLAIWQAAGTALGYDVQPEARGGLSDGNHIWNHVPTLDGLGPAGANAHCSEQSADGSKEQEYVVASSFVPKSLLNLAAILNLLAE